MKTNNNEPEEIGKKHPESEPSERNGSERGRDEQRVSGGPRYGGEDWKVADERGDNRFGKARNDDAEPSEVVRAGEDPDADVEEGHDENLEAEAKFAAGTVQNRAMSSSSSEDSDDEDSDDDNEVIESGGEMAGMGRGEKPRKPKSRAK